MTASSARGLEGVTRFLAAVLVWCALIARASALQVPLDHYATQPPPAFGEQHVETALSPPYLIAWHTGPSAPRPPGDVPYYVYAGYFSPSARTFVGWEATYLYKSNGQWVDAVYSTPFFESGVAKYPELSRYAPGCQVEFDINAGPQGPLGDVPADDHGESCPTR